MSYRYFNQDYDSFLAHAEITKEDMKYGLPEKKAYPMPDRKHVMSAIKFFNYVSPKDEEALAKAILARMDEYGISEVNVGPDNRFGKYYEKTSLKHHGILGQRKGERRWQNPDGSWTPAGRERYGKGGKPRGDYKDEGKTAAKKLNRNSGADFDGDTKFIVKIEDVDSDFKQAIKDARHSNHKTVKYLSDKDSIKKLAEGTQASYEKYQTAAKKYQQLNSSEKASQLDLDAFRSAKTKYKEELKEVADKLLGTLKDHSVTLIGEYDGKPVPVSTTYSKLISDALWEANIERNKNTKHLSGPDFDGDVKKVIRLDKDNQGRSGMHLSGPDFDGDVKKVIRLDKVDRQYKYDEKTREAMREARKDGYDSLTASQKKLLREVAYDMMDEN